MVYQVLISKGSINNMPSKSMSSPTDLRVCFQRILGKNQKESFGNSFIKNNCTYVVSSHHIILKNNK